MFKVLEEMWYDSDCGTGQVSLPVTAVVLVDCQSTTYCQCHTSDSLRLNPASDGGHQCPLYPSQIIGILLVLAVSTGKFTGRQTTPTDSDTPRPMKFSGMCTLWQLRAFFRAAGAHAAECAALAMPVVNGGPPARATAGPDQLQQH